MISKEAREELRVGTDSKDIHYVVLLLLLCLQKETDKSLVVVLIRVNVEWYECQFRLLFSSTETKLTIQSIQMD